MGAWLVRFLEWKQGAEAVTKIEEKKKTKETWEDEEDKPEDTGNKKKEATQKTIKQISNNQMKLLTNLS